MIYLYLKTHRKTGLKYLGKTTRNPSKYLGSGKYWRRHLKVYGNDVHTDVLLVTENEKEIADTGLFFSKLWGIVESKEYANLREENGDGGSLKGRTMSSDQKRKISETLRGSGNPFYGKAHSPQTRKLISDSLLGQTSPMKGKKMPESGIKKKSKKVIVDQIEYPSAKSAAEMLNISYSSFTWRCRSNNFPNYYYVQ